MHPYQLQQELATRLQGRILQDVTWSGGDLNLGHLAPCCGRVVQAVRWVKGNGHVWLSLEPPDLEDEPPGLFLPAIPVERVSGHPFGVTMYCPDGKLVLGIGPLAGRDKYAIPSVMEQPAAALFLQALQSTSRLTAKAAQDALGISYRRSQDTVAAWERAGWLERRGMYRYVSEAGERKARQVLGN